MARIPVAVAAGGRSRIEQMELWPISGGLQGDEEHEAGG